MTEEQLTMHTDTSCTLPETHPEIMRLQRFLARCGVASRRGAETLIAQGHVTVNGNVVTKMGTKINIQCDEVRVDGTLASLPSEQATIMLNKPAGYLTAMSDARGKPCVSSLIPLKEYPALYPIGRLDFNTTGLLLFSTDGQLGHGLLHPSKHVYKTYEALVQGRPSKKVLRKLEAGVMLNDGITQPAKVRVLTQTKTTTLLEITIHEGRNRQVRRMCRAVGHEVIQLHRVAFGPVRLGSLEQGQWRLVTTDELAALYRA